VLGETRLRSSTAIAEDDGGKATAARPTFAKATVGEASYSITGVNEHKEVLK